MWCRKSFGCLAVIVSVLANAQILAICAVVTILASSGMTQASVTVATFSDPASSGSTPLFTILTSTKQIIGGWNDSQSGLNLKVNISGKTFNDVFFTMTPLSYQILSGGFAITGTGVIKFFEDDTDPVSAMPILQIDFKSVVSYMGGISGDNIYSNSGVKFSGSEIGSRSFSAEMFSFSFANIVVSRTGISTSAAFTSSAVPEPCTIILLSFGGLLLHRREK